MKKKILMVSCSQFGYHTDMYKYSEYLCDKYEIHNICEDQGHRKISCKNINVKYISKNSNKIANRLNFFGALRKYINEINPEYIIVDYFFACFLINFLSRKSKNIIDFRTGAVGASDIKRTLKNKLLTFESKFFENCIVISEGLKALINIKCNNTKIITLGADKQVSDEFLETKIINEVRLFYVGVLTGRNIMDTVIGFHKFINEYKEKIHCSYDIVGYGKNREDESEIENYIKENDLQNYIQFHGRINNDKLLPFFENNNIGVSYVPLNDYYQVQPPTKTFEYLKNAMICIATDTIENRKVINELNGVLIEDNAESFYRGLEKIYLNIKEYDKKEIYKTVDKYSWGNIVKELEEFILTI